MSDSMLLITFWTVMTAAVIACIVWVMVASDD